MKAQVKISALYIEKLEKENAKLIEALKDVLATMSEYGFDKDEKTGEYFNEFKRAHDVLKKAGEL